MQVPIRLPHYPRLEFRRRQNTLIDKQFNHIASLNNSDDRDAGNDLLYGESGNDTIAGGVHNDLLLGGAGIVKRAGGTLGTAEKPTCYQEQIELAAQTQACRLEASLSIRFLGM